jgi:CTP-dependent riboflavin kinase
VTDGDEVVAMPIVLQGRIAKGAGLAAPLHTRLRGMVLENAVGVELHPGTLNVQLTSRFPWEETDCLTVQLPDPRSYSLWSAGKLTPINDVRARLYPVVVEENYRAWVLRLDRSRASMRLVELISPVRLRDVLPSSTVVIKVGA